MVKLCACTYGGFLVGQSPYTWSHMMCRYDSNQLYVQRWTETLVAHTRFEVCDTSTLIT